MRALLLTGLVLTLAACVPRKTVSPPSEDSSDTGDTSGAAITLERNACFGGCPVYRISVSPNGVISFEGKAHVRRLGPATGQIPAAQVKALISELDKAGYFEFADRYTRSEPACGRYSTDSPSAIISVQLRGRTKRIEHDYGCAAAPGALIVLERRIDEVLRSAEWTGR